MQASPLLPPRQFRVNRMLWMAIAAIGVIDVLIIWLSGYKLEIKLNQEFLLAMAGCLSLVLFCRYVRRDDTLFFFGNVILQLMAISIVASLAEYYGETLRFPLVDAPLHRVEQWAGFDWLAYIHWVNDRPSLAMALNFAYDSFGAQAMLLLCSLFIMQRSAHGQRFIIIGLSTAIITIIGATLYPALGEYMYYHIKDGDFANIFMFPGLEPLKLITALRDSHVTTITYPGTGTAFLPSYHAIMAGMLMYASLPFRYLRWLIIPANILMLLATMTSGGHYLLDVITGVMVFVLAVVFAEYVLPRSAAK